MTLLNTFKYEAFISYGWAGTNDPDAGARQWAAQLRDVLLDRLAVNLERPRIFFDAQAGQSGRFTDSIYQALEESAMLIFLVSPASYRTQSWCQKEVAYFWDHARSLAKSAAVLAPEDRILKVIQSPVSGPFQDEPVPLRELRSFELFERIDTEGKEVAAAADLLRPTDAVRRQLDRLFATLRTCLEQIKDLEVPDPNRRHAKRVFLGPTFAERDAERFRELRRELLLEGHEVCSVTPLSEGAETEDEYQRRVERALENMNLAVHFVPRYVPSSSWQVNPAAKQIRQCLLKSKSEEAFSVFLWRDPDYTDFDAQCLGEIRETGPTKGDQNSDAMIFGELKVNVKNVLRRPPPLLRPNPSETFDVVIQHHDEDSADAARIRDYLKTKHRLKAQFANPTLPSSNLLRSIRTNEELFYKKSKAFVVLYGRTDDDWTNRVCFAIQRYVHLEHRALIVVAPPPEPPKAKKYYVAPDDYSFSTQQCFDRSYESVIDEWLTDASMRAIAQTGTP